jgi:hypothetical protein
MLGDMGKKVVTEHKGRSPFFPRICINLNALPLGEYETPFTNRDLRFTQLRDYFKYVPATTHKAKDKPFMLITDLIPNGKIRFGTWEELISNKQFEKEIAWLLKFSDMRPELLEIAEQNMQVAIYIYTDVYKYDKYLKDMVEKETGVRPNYSMLKAKALNEADVLRFEEWMKNKNKIVYKKGE